MPDRTPIRQLSACSAHQRILTRCNASGNCSARIVVGMQTEHGYPRVCELRWWSSHGPVAAGCVHTPNAQPTRPWQLAGGPCHPNRSIPEAMNDLHSRRPGESFSISTHVNPMGKKKSRAACPQHRRLSVAMPHLAFAAAARSVLRETIGSVGPASAMGYIGSRNRPENRLSSWRPS